MKKTFIILLMVILSISIYADKVSWYGKGFEGKLTASGYIFDSKQYTCASNKYPFGTVLKITNKENNKSVKVVVTDRGGFEKYGRTLDLSKKAFSEISSLDKGIINANIKVVNQKNTFKYKKGNPKFTSKEYKNFLK
ncbi:septal ring lytic transglycosylase RlpA family protein [Fusobacterium perfoetens]|uniref:septal ring lytic transglycosylase RlpA family protein n=1 Tax=Fusobacterium perfoetens TaxID=852 RepID=UPI000AA85EDF|nr:septal ring lytic transglycosylase RlpA family protein [Fusobacterium perfoetens]MCI6152443.1 septal ring lytic transglycosylase RlpA family protein [Fusobacterium perfoetens]MDY3237042.1 septal ring lytic transglycosylase RlpA family protein [Fusobacterium perfoetens]